MIHSTSRVAHPPPFFDSASSYFQNKARTTCDKPSKSNIIKPDIPRSNFCCSCHGFGFLKKVRLSYYIRQICHVLRTIAVSLYVSDVMQFPFSRPLHWREDNSKISSWKFKATNSWLTETTNFSVAKAKLIIPFHLLDGMELC